MSTRPPSRRRRVLFRLAAVLVGLALLEGGARILETFTPDRTLPTPGDRFDREFVRHLRTQRAEAGEDVRMIAEDSRRWSLEPGSTLCMEGLVPLRVNRLGMRGPEVGTRTEGEVRILVLGDSSCFGHGIAERLVMGEVAAEALTSGWGRPVTAINGCTPGYDSAQTLETLGHFGMPLQPDWVVVTCLWSDVYAPGEGGAPQTSTGILARSLGHSATHRVLARWLAPWTRPKKVRWIASSDDVATEGGGADARVGLAAYVANLRAIASRSTELGSRTAFVILPAPMDFDEVPPPAVVSEYREGMRLAADEAGAVLVEGPAVFEETGLGVEGFLDKVHPSVAGHEALGTALAEALAAEPPPEPRAAPESTPEDLLEPLPYETLIPACRPDRGKSPEAPDRRRRP